MFGPHHSPPLVPRSPTKRGKGVAGMGRKWLEMQDVSLDAFAVFASQDGVIVKKIHNFVGSFKFCCQLLVFVQEIVNTHKHLLIQREIVNLGMFVKCTFLLSFLHFTVLNGSRPLFCQLSYKARPLIKSQL